MNLLSLASHFPAYQYTQTEVLEAMQSSSFWNELKPRSHKILTKILQGDTGIKKRHFSLKNLKHAWSRDAQQLSETYEKEAPPLATRAVKKALTKQAIKAEDIDVLIVSSCTGYLCPGLSSYVAELLGCRVDIHTQDITGHGCGAAVPLIQAAAGYIALKPESTVVTVAVEVCSAAFYIDDDIGVLISTCLFGDGASAAVWSGSGGQWKAKHFQSLLYPEEREKVRFINHEGKLKNQLAKSVPALASMAAAELYKKSVYQATQCITHGGGRDVIEALEIVLPDASLKYARYTMENYGNLSSPSMFVALENYLEENKKSTEPLWLCGFGAGFSAHSCELVSTH